MFKTSDIRRSYLDFFITKNHTEVPSSSLIPDNDPTLMFTNSGMVQFKDVFIGKKVLPFRRATTAQKSLRAGGKHNDLDNVGYTARHHTFFEMMGNFSFGDYFKEEAITWAWEYITKILELPKERLLVTVHSSDEEAASLWKKTAGFRDDKIIRISTNDNFWTMGDTGPCGPCSEIFYDHGDKIQGGPPGSANEDGDRFIEIWNLVFTQFNTLPDGRRVPLDHPCIDTGMGLERIAAVMQGVHTNYDIDLFKLIINDVKNVTSHDNPKFKPHYNVIADHMRAICFMIADGITPSNEGRGYVLRRIIRRALRHGYTMGVKEPFLYKLVTSVKNAMGEHYKELIRFEAPTIEVVKTEETNFMKTIDKGMGILASELEKLGQNAVFPAETAYKLYDTYGFPLDLTQDILKSHKKTVNESDFEKISAKQKEKSKKAWAGTGDSFAEKVWYDLKGEIGETEFLRNTKSLDGEIAAIVKGDKTAESAEASEDFIYIVCSKTPFYAESGGQVGDVGKIRQGGSNIAEVVDTRIIAGIHAHKCVVIQGVISSHKPAKLEVNWKKRAACSRNHTATHMLQKALKEVLGEHIAQKGSQVTPSHLRFDFIHNEQITPEQIHIVERIINDNIDKGLPVKTEIMSLDRAVSLGATALFGEKYPDKARVVTIGNDWSKELCGGEHVSNTLQIKGFKILNVSSIGSGLKRIEALTGDCIRNYLENQIKKLFEKIAIQKDNIKNLEKKIIDESSSKDINFDETILPNGIKLMLACMINAEHKGILGIIDKQKSDSGQKIVLITNTKNEKVSVCLFVGENFDAIQILRNILQKIDCNIRVGGRRNLAQSGGIPSESIEKIKKHAIEILSGM